MVIKDFDVKQGLACQGDVWAIAIPKDVPVDRSNEIAPKGGRLIIQEGESTGHHHAFDLMEREVPRSKEVDSLIKKALNNEIPLPTAHFYHDVNQKVSKALLNRKILTRTDLTIGILVVENGPMCLSHEEHSGIRFPVGAYLLGGQIESVHMEERKVID